jgi:hypothetical protein
VSLQGWREEARQDRLTRAQIDREREAARTRDRIAERRAAAAARREDRAARTAERQQARAARAARRAEAGAWVRGHVTDLLFVPVIVVPGVLAWTAMAAFGRQVYGPPGLALPAFSEGAMWAFAAAVTITRRRHADKPVWHLRLGTWVFAAAAAAMNFAHGMTAGPGLHGPAVGAVMAMVSVAGVTAHQLVTAGPRRSRAERDEARIDRSIARREMAARRAALRQAVAQLDDSGHIRLRYAPKPAAGLPDMTAELAELADDLGAGLGAWAAEFGTSLALDAPTHRPPTATHPRTDPSPAPEPTRPGRQDADSRLAAWLTNGAVTDIRPAALVAASGAAPEAAPATASGGAPGVVRKGRAKAQPKRTGSRTRQPVSDADAEMHFAADLAANQVPSARRIQRELHVGQERASAIRTYLESVTTAHESTRAGASRQELSPARASRRSS